MSSKLTNKELVKHVIKETPEWKFEFDRAIREIQAKEAMDIRTDNMCLVSNKPRDAMTWNPSFLKNTLTGQSLGIIIKHELLHLIMHGKSVEEAKTILLKSGLVKP